MLRPLLCLLIFQLCLLFGTASWAVEPAPLVWLKFDYEPMYIVGGEQKEQGIIITQFDNTRFFSRPRTYGVRLRAKY